MDANSEQFCSRVGPRAALADNDTRTVTRSSRPKQRNLYASSNDNEEGFVELQKKRRKLAPKPTAKAAAIKPGRPSRQGLLEQLLGAPLDILYEIFCWLEPLDILRLSRSSKDLLSLLMRESSAFVWLQARVNVGGLPELPSGMNEAQYANLVFASPCCHCASPTRFIEMIWTLQIRYVSFTYRSKFDSYDTTKDAFKKVLKVLRCRRSARPSRWNQDRPVIVAHALETDAARKDWLARKAEEKEIIEQWARECHGWTKTHAKEHTQTLETVKAKRYNEIVRRLTKFGWGKKLEEMEGDFHQSELRSHKFVDQANELTDQAWEKICPELVDWIEAAKDARLEREDLSA
ncbi:hypothetical protein C8J56DRAFT_1157693 [Mycena floridula]|nr:hypothetical protein C8J56DRAFT_1157693 [Mycena floridula]